MVCRIRRQTDCQKKSFDNFRESSPALSNFQQSSDVLGGVCDVGNDNSVNSFRTSRIDGEYRNSALSFPFPEYSSTVIRLFALYVISSHISLIFNTAAGNLSVPRDFVSSSSATSGFVDTVGILLVSGHIAIAALCSNRG